ncbi:MAG: type VII toxin-antitoxin system MntA family adenylyltransferase antitoxin [Gemmatimonadota bacterium]
MAIAEKWKGFASLPPDLQARLEGLPRLLEERGVALAYLFGSAASPSSGREVRDVDLAILTDGDPVEGLRMDIQDALGTERLDLVDLSGAGPVLRFEVVRAGGLLYARDDETLNRFEIETLHVYRDTAPMRRRQAEYLRERMRRWS